MVRRPYVFPLRRPDKRRKGACDKRFSNICPILELKLFDPSQGGVVSRRRSILDEAAEIASFSGLNTQKADAKRLSIETSFWSVICVVCVGQQRDQEVPRCRLASCGKYNINMGHSPSYSYLLYLPRVCEPEACSSSPPSLVEVCTRESTRISSPVCTRLNTSSMPL